MKDTISLDDILTFLAVVEAGGLAGAVPETGQSAPTLSRKMTALEQRTGRRLFQRGNRGYVLTADGRALVDEASALQEISGRLSRWFGQDRVARVRITAGTWTARWLTSQLSSFWQPGGSWLPEFLGSNATLDIARREADIGFRNQRPTQSWLAARRLRQIDYATFGRPGAEGFVALAPASTPSARWVVETHGDDILTTVSDPRLALDLVRQGIGQMVLPIFAGQAADGVSQLSDPIGELTHEEWLVTHHDARHDPPVRRAIDAITDFILRQDP